MSVSATEDRARLDVTGELPTPQEVRDFLASTDQNKRQKKIDEWTADSKKHWTVEDGELVTRPDYVPYLHPKQ